MTSRQRVLETLAHRQADRIPVDFWAESSVADGLIAALKLPDREALLRHFHVDLRYFNGPALKPSDQGPQGHEGISYDHWGVARSSSTVTGTRRDGTSYEWTYKHLHKAPLAEAASVPDIERHAWPKAEMWDFSGVRDACQAVRDSGFAVVAGADRLDRTALLKPAMYLRGTEQFMADLVLEPELAEAILQHIAAHYLDYNRRFFEAAGGTIDIFFMGDDMGTQSSTWVSPAMYRRFFKRPFAAYCELAHRFGAKTMYHTCGRVTPLVGEFVDSGLDILQSLQPVAMGAELATIKREFGHVLCFQGGIDIQNVLPKGTPQQVRQHVQATAKLLGPGGGYIFGTAHNILPDVPLENVLALFDAYQEFGTY